MSKCKRLLKEREKYRQKLAELLRLYEEYFITDAEYDKRHSEYIYRLAEIEDILENIFHYKLKERIKL